jgi:ATP-grasp domain
LQSLSQLQSKGSVVALITATTPWPLSARLAVRLIAHGCTVHALCPRGDALATVAGMGRILRYSGLRSLAALQAAVTASSPDIVIPCDERAVWQLHELHELRPEFRPLIETSLGAPGSFVKVRSRAAVMELAREAGISTPETQVIRSEEDILAWFAARPGMAVVKLDGTWGGSGVQIVGTPQRALQAWRRFAAREPPGTSLKRWIIDGDPLAFWRGQSHQTRTVSIQRYVAGRPANAMLAAWRGKLLGFVSVEVLCTQGPTGASTVVRLLSNADIEHAARVLVQELGLSGFAGLDFILEEGTGAAHLIEFNARCTQLGHLVLPGQGDLAGMLCVALGMRGASRTETPIDRDVIAFFPQALAWNPDSPYMQQCHHDVPWSEPALVRELLRDSWAERRWLTRLYNRVRGAQRSPVPNPASFLRLAASDGRSVGPQISGPVKRMPDAS